MFSKLSARIFAIFSIIIILLFTLTLSVSAANGKITVILDPGHGGVDGGTDEGPKTEKEYNLAIAEYLKSELEKNENFEVYLTREDNETFLKFTPRAMKIIEHNADIMISLHCNSNTATYVNGCDAIVSLVDNYGGSVLAGDILDALSAAVPIRRGKVQTKEDTGDSLGIYYWDYEKKWDMPGAWWLGQKSDYYSISTWSSKFGVSSIIIEHGYLSNPGDCAIIAADENLLAMAKAEAGAIIEFFTGHEHVYTSEKVVDFPSNCTFAGTKSYRCTVCGAKKDTEALPADSSAHYYRQIESNAATCTSDGYVKYICQTSYNLNDKGYPCEVHYHTEKFAAYGHNYTIVENTPASHGVDGIKKSVCQNCGDIVSEILTGDAHNYEILSETSADCTNGGGTTYRCTLCEDEYTDDIPLLGHDFEITESVEVTANKDGYIKSICRRCGEEKTEIIPHCEHEFSKDTVAPQCEKSGSIFYKCQKCGYEKSELLPPLVHSFEVVSEVPPTCELDGVQSLRCSICGTDNDKIVSATEHSYVITEKKRNAIRKKCSVCGNEITEKTERQNSAKPIFIAITVMVAVLVVSTSAILMIKRNAKADDKNSAV